MFFTSFCTLLLHPQCHFKIIQTAFIFYLSLDVWKGKFHQIIKVFLYFSSSSPLHPSALGLLLFLFLFLFQFSLSSSVITYLITLITLLISLSPSFKYIYYQFVRDLYFKESTSGFIEAYNVFYFIHYLIILTFHLFLPLLLFSIFSTFLQIQFYNHFLIL